MNFCQVFGNPILIPYEHGKTTLADLYTAVWAQCKRFIAEEHRLGMAMNSNDSVVMMYDVGSWWISS